MRKRPVLRNVRGTGNVATLEETWTQVCVPGTPVDLRIQGLTGAGSTYRAGIVAAAYQEYRITGLTVTFVPQKDTFVSSAGDTVPNLYYMNDPHNALLNNMTETSFQSLGCRPIRLDDKIIVKTLKPSVIVVAAPAGTGFPSISKRSPWLSTNAAFTPVTGFSPSSVTHYGAKFLITNTIAGLQPYSIQVKATYQFRRPLIPAAVQEQV